MAKKKIIPAPKRKASPSDLARLQKRFKNAQAKLKKRGIVLGKKRGGRPSAKKAVGPGRRPSPKKTIPAGKRGRQNPGAAAVYEEFHGRAPLVDTDVETPVWVDDDLPGIGKLVALVVRTHIGSNEVTIGFDGKTLLAMNKSKTQLYIVGGNQAVKLSDFNIAAPVHLSEVLGRIVGVKYDTVKTHLVNGGDAIYHHKFGARNLPTLLYDTRNKLLSISGGGYDMPPEGIRK